MEALHSQITTEYGRMTYCCDKAGNCSSRLTLPIREYIYLEGELVAVYDYDGTYKFVG